MNVTKLLEKQSKNIAFFKQNGTEFNSIEKIKLTLLSKSSSTKILVWVCKCYWIQVKIKTKSIVSNRVLCNNLQFCIILLTRECLKIDTSCIIWGSLISNVRGCAFEDFAYSEANKL